MVLEKIQAHFLVRLGVLAVWLLCGEVVLEMLLDDEATFDRFYFNILRFT